jgi:hypothetical protein
LATTIAVALASSATPVRATSAAPGETVEVPQPDEAATLAASVEILERRARQRYDNREYGAAAEQWELAFGLVSSSPELEPRRQQIAFELAHAHVHANAHDHDPQHLERAKALLWSFIAREQRPGHVPSAAERELADRATELLEIINRRGQDEWQRARPPAPAPTGIATASAAAPDASLGRARGLIATGSIGLALGIVSVAIGGAMVHRDRNNPTKNGASNGATTAIAIGCILGSAGVVMLGFGIAERVRVVRVNPTASRTTAGLAITGRF